MHHRSFVPFLLAALFVCGSAQARIIPARALERVGFCARQPQLCQSPVNRRRLSQKPVASSPEGARNR